MKLIYVYVLLCTSMTSNLFSQDFDKYCTVKRIKTTGYAETLLEPSLYILEIVIQETMFQPTNYNQPAYIDFPIDTLERYLKKWVTDMGLSEKDLTPVFIGTTINNGNSRNINLINEKYELKVKNYSDLNKISKSTKFKGLTGFRILRKFYVDPDEVQKKLYIAALKNSRIKAENILSSVHKTLGDIILLDMYSNQDQFIVDDAPSRGNYNGNSMEADLQQQKKISVSLSAMYEIK